MSILNIFLVTAGVVAVVTIALAMAVSSARKSLRNNAQNWFRANDLDEYMVAFTLGDAIGLNYKLKEIGFSSQGQNFKVPYSSLVSVEIVEDGATITKTSRSSQLVGMAVGGALLGGAGALIGGLSGTTTSKEKIKKISLQVITNIPAAPFIEIRIFQDQEIQKGGLIYNHAISEIMPWYGRLKAILEDRA